jgi:hypothetical protein
MGEITPFFSILLGLATQGQFALLRGRHFVKLVEFSRFLVILVVIIDNATTGRQGE